jgi:hypothetical protein
MIKFNSIGIISFIAKDMTRTVRKLPRRCKRNVRACNADELGFFFRNLNMIMQKISMKGADNTAATALKANTTEMSPGIKTDPNSKPVRSVRSQLKI